MNINTNDGNVEFLSSSSSSGNVSCRTTTTMTQLFNTNTTTTTELLSSNEYIENPINETSSLPSSEVQENESREENEEQKQQQQEHAHTNNEQEEEEDIDEEEEDEPPLLSPNLPEIPDNNTSSPIISSTTNDPVSTSTGSTGVSSSSTLLGQTPPIFDTQLKRGQVKIIRTGDVMYVMKVDHDGKQSIESYSRPVKTKIKKSNYTSKKSSSASSSSTKPVVRKRKVETSPFKSKRVEGEAAITTISRYCFPTYHDAQLQQLTLVDILQKSKQVVSSLLNDSDDDDDHGIASHHVQFLTNKFLLSDVGSIIMKDWEVLRDIFDGRQQWKVNQMRKVRLLQRRNKNINKAVIVSEVSYPPSTCLKTLPRFRTARERKEDLKNYDTFVDLGSRLDFTLLQKKRGTRNTFIVPPAKVQILLQRSSFYGHLTTRSGKGFTRKYLPNKKSTSSFNGNGITSTAAAATVTKKKYAGKSKNKLKNLVPINMIRKKVGKSSKISKGRSLKQITSTSATTNTTTTTPAVSTTTTKQEPSALEKLNPRRDKPMAKIRSQVRKVDRMAKLNGDSFHNAALALSRTSGLNRISMRTYGITNNNNNNFQEPSSSSSTTTTSITGPTTTTTNLTTIFSSPSSSSVSSKETDLDLGLEGVCFDPEVNELTNSVMVSVADLEYLDGLDKDSVDLNFSTGTETMTTNSLVAALHAGINNNNNNNNNPNLSTTSILTEPSISSSTIMSISTNPPPSFTTTNTTNTTNTTISMNSTTSRSTNNPVIIAPPLSTLTMIDGIGNLTFSTCSNTSTTTINSTSFSTITTSSLIPLKLDNDSFSNNTDNTTTNNNNNNTTTTTGFNFDDIDNRLLDALDVLGAEIGEDENSNSKNEMLLEMTPAQNQAFESLENQLIADYQQEELPTSSNNNNNNVGNNDNPMNINTKTNSSSSNNNNHALIKKLNTEEIQEKNPSSQQPINPSSINFLVTDNYNPHISSSSSKNVQHKDNSIITTEHQPIPITTNLTKEEKGNESTLQSTLISNNNDSLTNNNLDMNTLHQSENDVESQKLPNQVESNTNNKTTNTVTTTTTSTVNKTMDNFVPLNQANIATTTLLENKPKELESETKTLTVSNLKSYKRSTRTTLPPKLESPESSNDQGTPNKKTAALLSTLTGNYWKTPDPTENATPANRPRRANAGALMATKFKLKNKEARKLAALERKSKLSSTSQKKPPRINNNSGVKDWNGKFSNKGPYEEPITPDGMIISQKTALKCIVSIPDKFVPTPHENFLQPFVDYFEESELFELYKVFNRVGKGKNSKYFHKKQYEDFKKSTIYFTKFHKTTKQKKLDSPVLSSETNKIVSCSSTASSSFSPPCSPPILTPITTTTITTTNISRKSKTTIATTTSLPRKIIPTTTTKLTVINSPSSSNTTIKIPSSSTSTTTTSSEANKPKTEEQEHSKVPVIEKLERELLSNDILIPETTFKGSISKDSSLEIQSQSQVSEQKEQEPQQPEIEQVTLKEEKDETIVPSETSSSLVSKPKSSFHRKRYEDDEKTEYIKMGTDEIVSNGVTYFVDHVNYKMEKDVIIDYDDYDFKPEITKDLLTTKTEDTDIDSTKDKEKDTLSTTIKSKSTCTLPYCLLGCVCDSLKGVRRPRDHCGKLKCMIDCTCGQGSTADDADIRSRLRPRVSMLNWSSRLNYPEAYFQEREMLGKMNGSYGESYNPYARVRRPIIPPKRNSDFVFHCPTKKSRLEQAKSLGRQGTGRATTYNRFRLNQRHYTNLKNENAQGKQTKDTTLGRLHSDSRGIRKGALDKITKPVIQRAVQIQRNVAHRTHRTLKPSAHNQQMSRSQIMARNRAIQGNGDLIPPELMAQFIPFMEIHVPPPRNKVLLLSSDSESSDDENEEEEHEVKYAPPRAQRISDPVSTVENKEDVFVPVIVSYTSKQDGFSEIIYPNNDGTNQV